MTKSAITEAFSGVPRLTIFGELGAVILIFTIGYGLLMAGWVFHW